MRNRLGLRSPAAAASRMRTATSVLLDRAFSSGAIEAHASSKTDRKSLTVSWLYAVIAITTRPVRRFVALFCSPLEDAPPRLISCAIRTLTNACTGAAQSAGDTYRVGRSSGAGHHKHAIAMAHTQTRRWHTRGTGALIILPVP